MPRKNTAATKRNEYEPLVEYQPLEAETLTHNQNADAGISIEVMPTQPLPESLLADAEQRTLDYIKSVRKMLLDIELEIELHDGIYPYNSGRASGREVCRRAGVSHQTLQGALHRDTTRVEVNSWVKRIESKSFQGAKIVRKQVTERADSWKARHDAMAQHYHEFKLEVVNLKNWLKNASDENLALRAQLSVEGNAKVAGFVPRKHG